MADFSSLTNFTILTTLQLLTALQCSCNVSYLWRVFRPRPQHKENGCIMFGMQGCVTRSVINRKRVCYIVKPCEKVLLYQNKYGVLYHCMVYVRTKKYASLYKQIQSKKILTYDMGSCTTTQYNSVNAELVPRRNPDRCITFGRLECSTCNLINTIT